MQNTEAAETFLSSLGFTDFRVRLLNGCARVQILAPQMPLALKHRRKIVEELKRYYSGVLLDLEARDE